MKLFNKFAIACTNAAMNLGVVGINEAQAAVFNFNSI